MQGGIKAWNGTVAQGFPEAAMSFFASARTPEEYIALAWLLEEGARKLYEGIAGNLDAGEAAALLLELASAEERHKEMLSMLYERRSTKETDGDFSTLVASEEPKEEWTEGGVPVQEVLLWAKAKPPREILELIMSLELNAYDRYLTMERVVEDKPSKEVFRVLSRAEKSHIEKVSTAFEEML
jgi:sulfur-carrier protein adenylyltransferase/sulfurtransferase